MTPAASSVAAAATSSTSAAGGRGSSGPCTRPANARNSVASATEVVTTVFARACSASRVVSAAVSSCSNRCTSAGPAGRSAGCAGSVAIVACGGERQGARVDLGDGEVLGRRSAVRVGEVELELDLVRPDDRDTAVGSDRVHGRLAVAQGGQHVLEHRGGERVLHPLAGELVG